MTAQGRVDALLTRSRAHSVAGFGSGMSDIYGMDSANPPSFKFEACSYARLPVTGSHSPPRHHSVAKAKNSVNEGATSESKCRGISRITVTVLRVRVMLFPVFFRLSYCTFISRYTVYPFSSRGEALTFLRAL